MKKIEESIHIDRPADEVFAFFDNRANDRRWMGSVEESDWLEPDEVTRLGRKGRMVMTAMGRKEFSDEVTEYEPGRKVAHRSVSDSMTVHSSCAVKPEGEGCQAIVAIKPERIPGGIFGKLLIPFILSKMRRDLKADLRRLKNILEERN